jgi:hypothetical protein
VALCRVGPGHLYSPRGQEEAGIADSYDLGEGLDQLLCFVSRVRGGLESADELRERPLPAGLARLRIL